MSDAKDYAIYTDRYGDKLPVRVWWEMLWRGQPRFRVSPLMLTPEGVTMQRLRFVNPTSLSERMTLDELRKADAAAERLLRERGE